MAIQRKYQMLCLLLCIALASFPAASVAYQYEGGGNEGRKGLSKLDLIELEYQADISGLKQPTLDGLSKDKDESEKNTTASERKTFSSSFADESEITDDNKHDKPQEDFLTEGSDTSAKASADATASEPSRLKVLLSQVVDNHKNAKATNSKDTAPGSFSSTKTEPKAVTESIDDLKAKLNALAGIEFRDLVVRPDFSDILAAAARLEALNPSNAGNVARLAKYHGVIKEGIEAGQRASTTRRHAKLLKEVASEKKALVDAEHAKAKALAERDDALQEKISVLKEQLAMLEAEKESLHLKFHNLATQLSNYLAEASEAQEEYQAAVREANEEEAAQELAREATDRAEAVWAKFLSSI